MIASFPENIHEIHNIHGIPWMRVSCVRSHARKGASRKARLVTICHRLREGPFFLVLEGERRPRLKIFFGHCIMLDRLKARGAA